MTNDSLLISNLDPVLIRVELVFIQIEHNSISGLLN